MIARDDINGGSSVAINQDGSVSAGRPLVRSIDYDPMMFRFTIRFTDGRLIWVTDQELATVDDPGSFVNDLIRAEGIVPPDDLVGQMVLCWADAP